MSNTAARLAEEIIAACLAIRGDKVITLYAENSLNPVFIVDISKEGRIGYASGHELVFKAKLVSALQGGGGMIVRQFLPIKVERLMPNGKKMWVPKKKVYGMVLGQNRWAWLSAEEVRRASCTDPEGRSLEPEPDVIYSGPPSSPAPKGGGSGSR